MGRYNGVARGRLQVAGIVYPRQGLAVVIVATALNAVVEANMADGENGPGSVIATLGCEGSTEGSSLVTDVIGSGWILVSSVGRVHRG